MRIGLTYDLRSWYLDRGYSMEDTAEFDKQETIDAIDDALHKMGFETEPVGNCFQLIDALSAGRRWDLVFNIAEGLSGRKVSYIVLEPGEANQYLLKLKQSDLLPLWSSDGNKIVSRHHNGVRR